MTDEVAAFDISVRVLVCEHCLAPLPVPESASLVTCAYCGAVSAVEKRPVNKPIASDSADASQSVEHAEAEQRKVLWQAQQDYYLHYAQNVRYYPGSSCPPGLESVRQHMFTQLDSQETLAAVSKSYQEIVSQFRLNPTDETLEWKLFWISEHLASVYSLRKEFLQARAIMEYGVELFKNEVYRHKFHCLMVGAALVDDDLVSAEAWLQRCDANTRQIDLFTSYQFARAMIAIQKEEWSEILSPRILGLKDTDVPLSPMLTEEISMFRVNALEALGRQQEAEALLKRTLAKSVKRIALIYRQKKTLQYANRTWDRLEQKGQIKFGWVRVGPVNLPTGCVVPSIVIALAVMALLGYLLLR